MQFPALATLIAAALLTAAGARGGQTSSPLAWKSVAPGLEHAQFTRAAPSGGTWKISALRLDLARVRLDVVHANDAPIGVETVSAIARRHRALAAVNGGYFRTGGEFTGDATGTLQ